MNTTPSEQLCNFFKALDDIWQLLSTKIMIQCKDWFWEAEGIKGGFSTTTLPIGKLQLILKIQQVNKECVMH